MTWFRLKDCVKCGGDLVLDEGDWLCLQCGTYYYTGLYRRPGWRKQPMGGNPLLEKEKTGHERAPSTGGRWVIGLGRASLAPTEALSTGYRGECRSVTTTLLDAWGRPP